MYMYLVPRFGWHHTTTLDTAGCGHLALGRGGFGSYHVTYSPGARGVQVLVEQRMIAQSCLPQSPFWSLSSAQLLFFYHKIFLQLLRYHEKVADPVSSSLLCLSARLDTWISQVPQDAALVTRLLTRSFRFSPCCRRSRRPVASTLKPTPRASMALSVVYRGLLINGP